MKDYIDMSEEELREEKGKIDYFLSNKTAGNRIDSNLDIFYNSLIDYFNDSLSTNIVPLISIRNRTNKTLYNSIKRMQHLIDKWTDTILKRDIKRTERIKIYKLVFELIGQFILDNNKVLSLTSIILYQNMFPGVIERAFPGYIKSGMIDLILNAKKQEIDEEDLI